MGCEHCLNEIKEGEIILAKKENDNNYLNNLESQDKILLSDKKNDIRIAKIIKIKNFSYKYF